MGFAKHKRRVRTAIEEWGCKGFWGYGQGRAVSQYGEELLRGKSACIDICTKKQECMAMHYERMDRRYPQLAQIVGNALKVSKLDGSDPVKEIMSAMERSAELDLDEALEVKRVVEQFGIPSMTDHYRAGQFENIQNGLDRTDPAHRRVIPEEVKKAS